MPKKKASAAKPARPNKTSKHIVSIQHREIKHTGRKFDNAFLEMRLWIPLWELPLWLFPSAPSQPGTEFLQALKTFLTQQMGGQDGE